jgi:rhamnulokinase
MPNKYLAFDLGAESGRAMLGTIAKDKLQLEELHRFPNVQIEQSGHIRWDARYLFDELKKGLALAAKQGHADLVSVGVDTWGVDFGLLDKRDMLVDNPVVYRDARTNGMVDRAFKALPVEELYGLTGIQIMQINTIFQLFSLVEGKDPSLAKATTLLFMPDLFGFLLTGEKTAEYTIASTSQLMNARTKTWAFEVFEKLHLPRTIVNQVTMPGSRLGKLLPDVADEVGLSNVEVISSGGHDTACAVGAVPASSDNWAYISSGTWSLVGVEVNEPILDELARQNNFTNEGGINGKIRFLRNTMGLWLLQRCQREWAESGDDLDYAGLVRIARDARAFQCIVNPDDPAFLNPDSMLTAIADYCKRTNQPVPQTRGGFVRTILESLALKYRYIIGMIDDMRDRAVETIHIVGGGTKNRLLNQFTADATGLTVIAGPVEATAMGNIISQAIAHREIADFGEGRRLVLNSTSPETYTPRDYGKWTEVYQRVIPYFA